MVNAIKKLFRKKNLRKVVSVVKKAPAYRAISAVRKGVNKVGSDIGKFARSKSGKAIISNVRKAAASTSSIAQQGGAAISKVAGKGLKSAGKMAVKFAKDAGKKAIIKGLKKYAIPAATTALMTAATV